MRYYSKPGHIHCNYMYFKVDRYYKSTSSHPLEMSKIFIWLDNVFINVSPHTFSVVSDRSGTVYYSQHLVVWLHNVIIVTKLLLFDFTFNVTHVYVTICLQILWHKHLFPISYLYTPGRVLIDDSNGYIMICTSNFQTYFNPLNWSKYGSFIFAT